MTDDALKLKVDSGEVDKGTDSLKKFNEAGQTVDKTSDGLNKRNDQLASSVKRVGGVSHFHGR